jgi:helicase
MRKIDCGTSGQFGQDSELGWEDLRIGEFWTRMLKVLNPGPAPRPVQIKALAEHRVLETRRNLIVSAPTNGGKSLVGLLAMLEAVRRGRRAILIEPLRAIAREKTEELRAAAPRLETVLGAPVRVRISTGDYRSDKETLFAAPPMQGEIVVATPERLEALLRNPEHDGWLASVETVCVDEAHLIGSPHRGSTLEYLITRLLCLPAPPRLVLLSATLGDLERARSWLSPCDAIVVEGRQPPLSKEILELDPEEDANEVLVALAGEVLDNPNASVLVFVYQTRSTERLATFLREALEGRDGSAGSLAYHAQMGAAQRETVRAAFQAGRCRCVVATTALGLGVNLPATHVIVRDTTFPGVGPLSTGDLLQMMGRAGRGRQAGHAVAILRPSDARSASELRRDLSEERLPDFISHFDRLLTYASRKTTRPDTDTKIVATHVAAYLSHCPETASTVEELRGFFERSLGGKELVRRVPGALEWLSDPARVLAHQGEGGSCALTTLGLAATRTVLPLDLAAGFAQLLRDLLTLDPSDQLLAAWRPLDHLVVLELLFDRSPSLRRFNSSLPRKLDAWMDAAPERASLLYREWISGSPGTSRAYEVLGSLGLQPPAPIGDNDEWARKKANLAVLRSAVLHELGRGVTVAELERRWDLKSLDGTEERWRDQISWLLSGVAKMLDLRCFYFHLREQCDANPDRTKRVKRALFRMRAQTFELREHLTYCSPLGPILHDIREARSASDKGPSVAVRSIRQLEQAGIRSFEDVASLKVEDLVRLGVRRDFAGQIYAYVSNLT